MNFVLSWVLHAIALLGVAYLMPASVHVSGFLTAIVAAALIGLVNALIKPLLVALTLPVTLLTLGLFILVINGALFYLVAHLLSGFSINSFGSAIIAAILYSIISWLLTALLLSNKK